MTIPDEVDVIVCGGEPPHVRLLFYHTDTSE